MIVKNKRFISLKFNVVLKRTDSVRPYVYLRPPLLLLPPPLELPPLEPPL